MTTDQAAPDQDRGPGTDEGGDPPCWAHLFADSDDERAHVPEPLGSASWEELVEQLADAVLIADRDGTITSWNQAAERLFGWHATEAVGANLDLIIPERHRARHWDGYRQTVATGITRYGTQLLEVPALHRDGRRLSIAFTLTLLRDPIDHRVTRLVAVVRDDTARWQERRDLRAEITRLRAGAASAAPVQDLDAEEPEEVGLSRAGACTGGRA